MLHVATTVQSCHARDVYMTSMCLQGGVASKGIKLYLLYVHLKLYDKWLMLS